MQKYVPGGGGGIPVELQFKFPCKPWCSLVLIHDVVFCESFILFIYFFIELKNNSILELVSAKKKYLSKT